MIDQKSLPVPTFVNTLSVSGFLNGNVNMLLTVTRWYPTADADGLKVAIDEVAQVDLRFDILCAQQMRDALDRIIEENSKPAGPAN
jgi:hypothetical protein